MDFHLRLQGTDQLPRGRIAFLEGGELLLESTVPAYSLPKVDAPKVVRCNGYRIHIHSVRYSNALPWTSGARTSIHANRTPMLRGGTPTPAWESCDW